MHTDEMAKLNYCSHWDTSGRKPYQRYTEAGGSHENSENLAICSGMTETPGAKLFTTDEIETLHALFMNEKPPEDGHRLQILRPEHNKVGVGLSRARDTFGRFTLCLAQEFLDDYGKLTTSWTKDKRQRFRTTLTPDSRWKSGLYYVIISAQRKNAQLPIVVSTRTMLLD